MTIAANIDKVNDRIEKVCSRTGRRRDEISLMAVSKFRSAGDVEQAYSAGIRIFGESRVHEACAKLEQFKNERRDIALHLIGGLQRNKTKAACNFFDCIQSVDREVIIGELVKHSALIEKSPTVMFELHTGEESKSGFSGLDALFRAVELSMTGGLKTAGLMTMAPNTDDEKLIRSSFRQLVSARKELQKRFPSSENWASLSMGMSNDFEIAVEEGSTMLRIGSLIFG
jgi:pyridoxal phosphate enzyme (YggS family)